jgi:lipoprotein-anchoring transpeptidase ErfK/SrfK
MSGACKSERQTPPIGLLLERGKAAARAGRKAEARYLFEVVLETTPDYPDALLWLAYLAGGGRPSLAYLARLLQADPTNQRARAAIRWARKRERPPAAAALVSRRAPAPGQGQHQRGMLAGLIVLMVVLLGGLATAAFAMAGPSVTLARVSLVVALASATPRPSDTATATATATATPSATPTVTPSPTASPSPSPTPTATPLPTATEPLSTFTPTPTPVPPMALPTVPVGDNFRWIDVDLTHQRLVAYEGETPVRTASVSTGLPRTPTVTGRFKIYVKYKAANMSGPGYFLRNVPYVMYFYGGYGLHGTYWHSNFGQPMSHGCVNLPTPDAEWLYNWASVGTLVVVHH